MSQMTTGEISRKAATASFEWKIQDFFGLSKEVDYSVISPTFSFMDAQWRLVIFPNGEEGRSKWVTLYVIKQHSTTENHFVEYRLGIRMEDGTECADTSYEANFKGNESNWGEDEFIERSVLLEMKSEIAPQDTLSILCTLHSNIRGSKEVASATKHFEGGDKCIERKGKDSENTNGVTEDATLPKPTDINKLTRDLENLLTTEKDSDVTLKLHNKEFRAHKIILRTRSSVFDSMFDHDMIEKNSGIVDIPDCDPEAFRYFLTYLNSASVGSLSNDIVFNLYFIADKYDIEELKHKCVDFMARNLSVDTFCNVVALALQHEESALLETATDFFLKNTKEVIVSVQWQSFTFRHRGIVFYVNWSSNGRTRTIIIIINFQNPSTNSSKI